MKTFSSLNAWIYRHEPRCLVKIDNITPRNYFKIFLFIWLFLLLFIFETGLNLVPRFVLSFFFISQVADMTAVQYHMKTGEVTFGSCTRVSVSSIPRRGKHRYIYGLWIQFTKLHSDWFGLFRQIQMFWKAELITWEMMKYDAMDQLSGDQMSIFLWLFNFFLCLWTRKLVWLRLCQEEN